jgi:hypothetical protein
MRPAGVHVHHLATTSAFDLYILELFTGAAWRLGSPRNAGEDRALPQGDICLAAHNAGDKAFKALLDMSVILLLEARPPLRLAGV